MDITKRKNYFIPTYLPLLISILFLFLLLTNPVKGSELVMNGLTIWFNKMIPSLFPFMVLSGILLRTDLSRQISKLFQPVLGRMFRLSPDCIYIILMGFLCGFPMGASIISESLSMKKISLREAELLLAFCNNIGPVYVISFVSVLCPYKPLWLTLSVMYLIPLGYGLILRHTKYHDIAFNSPINNAQIDNSQNNNAQISSVKQYNSKSTNLNLVNAKTVHKENMNLSQNRIKADTYTINTKSNLGIILQASVQKALTSIAYLGGYMIIFNVIQLPFYNSYYQLKYPYSDILKGFFEISSGIMALSAHPQYYVIVYAFLLPFCGLCCFYQTYAMIWDTPLSLISYFKHKIIQTFCSILAYIILFRI